MLHERANESTTAAQFLTTGQNVSSSCHFRVDHFFQAMALREVDLDSWT
jgi:hypothetical protein